MSALITKDLQNIWIYFGKCQPLICNETVGWQADGKVRQQILAMGKKPQKIIELNMADLQKKTFNKIAVEVLSSTHNYYNLFLVISRVCSHTFATNTRTKSRRNISITGTERVDYRKSNINSLL